MSFRKKFNQIYTEELEKIIDKKNIELFDIDDVSVFLYLFPLIERLLVEILDLSTLINIECKEQGMLRTVNSMIQQDEINEILDVSLIEKISKYFANTGIRNKLMHFNPNETVIKCSLSNVSEVKKIAIDLAIIYTKELKKHDYKVIDKIETAKVTEQ